MGDGVKSGPNAPGGADFQRRVLRKTLRQQRNALDDAQQAQAARALVAQLTALPVFQSSRAVALYLANDGEIDPSGVMDFCQAHGKRCYVPILPASQKDSAQKDSTPKTLGFAEITPATRFRDNRFGIAEPICSADECLPGSALDLVLVPLVGFDRWGNRIGMGGGFYDATFAFKKTDPQRPPHLVGLAHELQRVEKIATENWDIPIDAVVTNQHVYRCEKMRGAQ